MESLKAVSVLANVIEGLVVDIKLLDLLTSHVGSPLGAPSITSRAMQVHDF